jgi:hypothetical protein
MTPDPLSTALHEITQTKQLLELLITSSESFDYPRAKLALKELNRKVRQLGKLQHQLRSQRFPAPDPKIHVLDFAKPSAAARV